MESFWLNSDTFPQYDRLKGNHKTGVLVIGGGITGILCAYRLHKQNIPYILVEADRICNGITKNTTAKITSQHGLIYNKISQMYGTSKAALYLKANEYALSEYKHLCNTIDCDYETKDSYVYSLNYRSKLTAELDTLNNIGFPATYETNIPLPFHTAGAIKFPNQACFNPLKFIQEIIRELKIFEHTRIISISKKGALTGHGTILADKYIVCTHFPFINTHGSYFLKMYQQRSYVIAYKNAPDYNGMYIDESGNGLSFRNYKDYLLVGGGGHKTGKKGGDWQVISSFMKKNLPQATKVYQFATQDCMSLDGIPYIGQYSKNCPDLFVATGFNKWGMTSSMLSSIILSDLVTGKTNQYASLFSPSRNMLHPQLITNIYNATVNILNPFGKRCPHLGCSLKWNAAEHTWDCPCHGSRFTHDGELIDNPATGNLKK